MNDKFDDCESLRDLIRAVVSLREMIDAQFKPVPEIMTVKEAATYLKISERQLRTLSTEKALIAYSQLNGDGSAVRYRKPDLDDFLVSCRVPTLEEVR